MAKIRVYELAREFKLDNKELVRQLIDLGFDVRNHMSTLGQDEAQAVRDKLQTKRSEVVEEKRVTGRVIRRRRKKVEKPEAETAPAEEAEAPPEAEAPAEPTAEAEPAEEALQPEATTEAEAEPEPEVQPEAVAEAEPEPEPEPEPVPEAAAEAAPEPEAPEEAPAQAVAEPETQAEPETAPQPEAEAAPEPEAPQEEEAQAAEPQPPAEAQAPEEEEPEEEAAEAVEEVPVKAKAKPKPKAKKPARRGLDEPARIISRPKTPVAPTPTGRPVRTARPGGPGRPGPADRPPFGAPPAPPKEGEERTRRARKKGKKGGQIPDDEFLMRKASSRRREIKDKADLYNGRSRRSRRKPGKKQKTEVTTPKAIKRRVRVGDAITVGELAKRMGVKSAEVVGRLMKVGMMVTLNQALDVDDAALVAGEFGFEIEKKGFQEASLLERQEDKPEELRDRPPVVTVMGHVDHGKTSLLDAIRNAKVVDGEAGGITQHIGAYQVELDGGGQVVFVDTPGHEAFTQMRARGAQITDLVVLVVAADDGVMAQTKEAINHCKAAEVPLVVAVNKIDKPGADPDRVRRELADEGLVPEDWGGDVIFVNVSAKTGEGLDTLLEMLLLQAEVLELKANPDKNAFGHVLEAQLDRGRGAVATVLVQGGTLKVGDSFVSGAYAGKVRALLDYTGVRIDEAGPATPVEVQGFGGVPEAGDDFAVVDDDKVAKQVAEHRQRKKREAELSAQTSLSLEGALDQLRDGVRKELALVIKADTRGSVEALVGALSDLGNEEVEVNVIHSATGAITESDVMLAAASDALIAGFNVRPTGKVSEVADAEHVEIRTYEVIYDVINDVKAALTGMLAPLHHDEVIGRAEVRDTFKVPKAGMVAGSYITEGHVERSAMVRLIRDGVVVANSRISSLRRFKEDVKEVAQGYECGIGLENYHDIKVGDQIEVYLVRETAAVL